MMTSPCLFMFSHDFFLDGQVCKDLACKVDFAEPDQARGQTCFYKQQNTQSTDPLDFLVCTKPLKGIT